MADYPSDANQFDGYNPSTGLLARSFNMLPSAIVAPANSSGNGDGFGPWIDVRILKSFTVEVQGTFGGGNVQLFASNDPNPNIDGASGVALGSVSTTDGMISVTGPYRWVRIKIAGSTNPALTAYLHGCA